ncbi:MAG TPA: FtsX-like permease family protein, partial [Streptosporangiaceae bacterium]
TVLLGVLGVADVPFLNIRERAPELATSRSLGWRESALARLVISEAVVIGLLGSLAGAGAGLAATAWFAGQATHRMVSVAVAAAGRSSARRGVNPWPSNCGTSRRTSASARASGSQRPTM